MVALKRVEMHLREASNAQINRHQQTHNTLLTADFTNSERLRTATMAAMPLLKTTLSCGSVKSSGKQITNNVSQMAQKFTIKLGWLFFSPMSKLL